LVVQYLLVLGPLGNLLDLFLLSCLLSFLA
jgi:hypothetical protein